jgi:hypothetical protein|eukprot:COSAG06_NODE_925_length_11515_cov_2815.680448_6_plen_245_part_00
MPARDAALLAFATLATVARADYVPCDLGTCTCAGVSLGNFNANPYTLSDDDGHSYLLSICSPLGQAATDECSIGVDAAAAQRATFLRSEGGICSELGDAASMKAEVVEDGGRHVLVVQYNYTFGEASQVTIAFAVGSDAQPRNNSVAVEGNTYSIDWDGLDAEPPLPPPPPPPPPPPTQYHCDGASCLEGAGNGTHYSTSDCDGQCGEEAWYHCDHGDCTAGRGDGQNYQSATCNGQCHTYECQ